jgi:hypothetical protein
LRRIEIATIEKRTREVELSVGHILRKGHNGSVEVLILITNNKLKKIYVLKRKKYLEAMNRRQSNLGAELRCYHIEGQ